MTRKRFVKLLMAFRISRNSANFIADTAIENGVSYAVAFGGAMEAMVEIAGRIIMEKIWAVRETKQAILAGMYET